jgi:hypothetical protein
MSISDIDDKSQPISNQAFLPLSPTIFHMLLALGAGRTPRLRAEARHSCSASAASSTRALADLATSIPGEFARELRQDLTYAARVYPARALVTVQAVTALALTIGGATGRCSISYGDKERLCATDAAQRKGKRHRIAGRDVWHNHVELVKPHIVRSQSVVGN